MTEIYRFMRPLKQPRLLSSRCDLALRKIGDPKRVADPTTDSFLADLMSLAENLYEPLPSPTLAL